MTPQLTGIDAVTFDFGGTLVHVDRAGLRHAAAEMARRVAPRLGPYPEGEFVELWSTERDRQFREEVPRLREVDLDQRFARVLARLRGMAAPADGESWDDAAAALRSDPEERRWAVETYSGAFIAAVPVDPTVEPLLASLARERKLAIVSNWPLASTVDRYVDAAGWAPHLSAVVVSQRVGTIKPHRAVFAAAEKALGGVAPEAILHVGDDWAADVVGAKLAGWRAAYLPDATVDSPFPGSDRDDSVVPDLELARLDALATALRVDLDDPG
ncbi:MAG: HAD family hydrolase [Chloroflexota bacterium]